MTHSAIRLHAHRYAHPARRRTRLDVLRAKPGPDPDFWRAIAIGAPISAVMWGLGIAVAFGLYHLGAML